MPYRRWWGSDWGGRIAIVAERTDTAVELKPDHDFVCLGPRGTRAEGGVVGDVGAEEGGRVAVHALVSSVGTRIYLFG